MSEEPVNFEEAMSRLERIVSDLENGTYSLEESIRKFEEGIALGRTCREFLSRADARVRTLVENRDGTFEERETTDGQ